MVKHCIEHNMYLGVCHTVKQVSAPKPNMSPEEKINSNQATYKPYSVFSAGECELIQELEDGRMLINVNLKQRFKAVEEVQTLPFSVFGCEPHLDDEIATDETELLVELKDKINHRLAAITHDQPRMQKMLNSPLWLDKPAMNFSFELFGILQLEADLQQAVLESTSPVERLNIALELLTASR